MDVFFYLSTKSFTSINKKIINMVPNLKKKYLSKLIFFCKFRSKKNTSSAVIFYFSNSYFKAISINSFVSRNALLTASKPAKTIFNRFCPF